MWVTRCIAVYQQSCISIIVIFYIPASVINSMTLINNYFQIILIEYYKQHTLVSCHLIQEAAARS